MESSSILVDRSPLTSLNSATLISVKGRLLPRLNSTPPLLPLPSMLHPAPAQPLPVKRSKSHQQNKRKPRSQSVTPTTKNPRAKPAAAAIATDPRDPVLLRCLDFMESVFSKSPPPSSLPMPSFPLTKPSVSNDLARDEGDGAGGVGFDAGATDGLRRLLGL